MKKILLLLMLTCVMSAHEQPKENVYAAGILCDPLEQAIKQHDVGLVLYLLSLQLSPRKEGEYYIQLANQEVDHLGSSAPYISDIGYMLLGLATVYANNPQQFLLSWKFFKHYGLSVPQNTIFPFAAYGGLCSPFGLIAGLSLMYKGFSCFNKHEKAYHNAIMIQKLLHV